MATSGVNSGVRMAASDISGMKRELSAITRNIDTALYAELRDVMAIPSEVTSKFKTAQTYFINQLLNNKLRPWTIAEYMKNLEFPDIADNIVKFAKKFNFPEDEQTLPNDPTNPKTVILNLLKGLKSELSQDELLIISESNSETFEGIFADFLESNKLNPSLTDLKQILQDNYREDLATFVVQQAEIISTLQTETFNRTVLLCLDTLNMNIFQLLNQLRDVLLKEHSTFQTQSVQPKMYRFETEFISLTFTEEVDTRTLPLTEGSDAELHMLMENDKARHEKKTRYINAHEEIYSPSLSGNLISLIGHPGTGKTFYCRKLMNEFATCSKEAFRFVLLISCRNGEWHALEELFRTDPGNTSEMLERFLKLMIPTCQEIVTLILKTNGNGLLLIVDSYDEFPSHLNFSSTLLYKLLKRQVMSKSTLLITSRPGAWNQLLRGYGANFNFNKSWQLIGFSPEQRDLFIGKMLSVERASICNAYLNSKPELNLLSLVPVNISLITQLVSSEVLLAKISSLTDMYTSLVLFSLDKQLKRTNPNFPGLISLTELPSDLKLEFNKLAELAYKGLLARKITFSPSEFPELESVNSKFTKGLGLFQIIKVVTGHGTFVVYLSLPHLTFQEFLSACHLSHKSPKQLVSIVEKIFSENTWPAMKVCIRFLCGITQATDIINIIIAKFHKPGAMINCSTLLFSSDYDIHSSITSSHLSVLPYILEAKGTSQIQQYHQLMLPYSCNIPHFYITQYTSPVDIYCLSEYSTTLPSHPSCIYLRVIINKNIISTDITTLQHTIASISIDTLLVKFSNYINTIINMQNEWKEQFQHYKEDIVYEVQQQHIRNRNALVQELHSITDNQDIFDTQKLMLILASLHLTVSSLQPITIQYKMLVNLINLISTTTSVHKPKHIYYQFILAVILDDIIMDELLVSLKATATSVVFIACYFTAQFLAKFVASQPNLQYLYIDDNFVCDIRKLLNQPLFTDSLFLKLSLRNMKGLYFIGPPPMDSLFNYLASQTSLEEIELNHPAYNPLQILRSIQHLSALKYLQIFQPTTPKAASLLLHTLTTNRRTLSCFKFREYKYFLSVHITDVLSLLPQCTNLQHIKFPACNLTHHHMQPLSAAINQLPVLVSINMSGNNITNKGLSKLCKSLNTNNTIREINLHSCSLSDSSILLIKPSSIPAIKSIIMKCTSLQEIRVLNNEFNELNKEDLKKFAELRNIKIH